jgi:hypothetical protein
MWRESITSQAKLSRAEYFIAERELQTQITV